MARCDSGSRGSCGDPARGGCVPFCKAVKPTQISVASLLVLPACITFLACSSQLAVATSLHSSSPCRCHALNARLYVPLPNLSFPATCAGQGAGTKGRNLGSEASCSADTVLAGGALPLQLCQGYTLELSKETVEPWQTEVAAAADGQLAPDPVAFSLLGTYYAASQGESSKRP